MPFHAASSLQLTLDLERDNIVMNIYIELLRIMIPSFRLTRNGWDRNKNIFYDRIIIRRAKIEYLWSWKTKTISVCTFCVRYFSPILEVSSVAELMAMKLIGNSRSAMSQRRGEWMREGNSIWPHHHQRYKSMYVRNELSHGTST